MFIFALCTCLVPVKLTYCQYKLFLFLVESFPVFSGRVESRDLICIRHTYQNDKICEPIGLLKSDDITTKALENRPPLAFWTKELTDPCLNLLESSLPIITLEAATTSTPSFTSGMATRSLCSSPFLLVEPSLGIHL